MSGRCSACPLVVRSGLAIARRHRCQAPPPPPGIANLSRETGVAFAGRWGAPVETAIAFAGGNWVFLLCFSVAVVLSVSTVAVQGRAVAMGVSCWPASVAAEASLVSKLPCRSILCAKKFALLGLMVGVSAKKFAQRARNSPKLAVCGVLGEFFRENAGGGVALGELFRG